ncbi:MAG: ribonuclease R [Myxococcales bacterium]|nr:ribonuclease R [Myxococcales bacterium]
MSRNTTKKKNTHKKQSSSGPTHHHRGPKEHRSGPKNHEPRGGDREKRVGRMKMLPRLEGSLEDRVWSHLESQQGKTVSLRELNEALDLNPAEQRQVRKYLKGQANAGWLEQFRGGRFVLREGESRQAGQILHGMLQINIRGQGYVQTTDGSRVSVAARDLGGAMQGDQVLVRTDKNAWGQLAGEIIGIERPFVGRLAGWLRKMDKNLYFQPDDERYPWIPVRQTAGLKPGDAAVVQVQRAEDDLEHIWVDVLSALVAKEGAARDIERGAALLGLETFPEDVAEEAERLAVTPGEAEREGRLDLREINLVTIDGEDARDFDDAVCLEKVGGQRWKLTVAIADVSHYVRYGEPLDQEAFRRGTSVYFPATCVPMLPEALSNNICSLRPNEDRLCMAVMMTYDCSGKRAKLVQTELAEAVMCSKARLTYTQVSHALDGKELADNPAAAFLPMLQDLEMLTKRLRLVRKSRGSLDFDLPEAKVVFDEEGEVKDIIRSERFYSHKLIEECMLQANEAVAGYLLKHNIPGIFRTHGSPDLEKIQNFIETMQHLGVPLNFDLQRRAKDVGADQDSHWSIDPRLLADLLHAAQGHPAQRVIHQALLRSMMQATYLSENLGHFGLALERYLHFTSPIRRYPDLWVHRLLKMYWQGQLKDPHQRELITDELDEVALQSSERERAAMQAERDVFSRYRARLMSRHLGEELDGTICGVAPFGFFVELDAYFVEGLVHIRELDGFYQFDDKRLALVDQRSGETYQLGDRLRIQVAGASPERGAVDFRPVQRLASIVAVHDEEEDEEHDFYVDEDAEASASTDEDPKDEA